MSKLDNLKSYKPGQCGNPNGRPKGSISIGGSLQKLLNREIEFPDPFTKKSSKGEVRDLIAARLVVEASKGNINAIKECFDRSDGKALQKIEQSGSLNINNINLKGMSDGALNELRQALENNED